MAFTLSARDKRALQRGALVVLVALAYVVGIRPSRARRALLHEQLEAERAVLVRERAAAARTAGAGAPPSDTVAARLFAGADPVIASASLAEYLAGEAEQHDVWVQQSTTRAPGTTADAATPLEVTLRAEGDLSGLLRLLNALERGPMLAQVVALDVRPAGDDGTGTAPLAITATVRSVATRAGASR